jgi:hypothetical protein
MCIHHWVHVEKKIKVTKPHASFKDLLLFE